MYVGQVTGHGHKELQSLHILPPSPNQCFMGPPNRCLLWGLPTGLHHLGVLSWIVIHSQQLPSLPMSRCPWKCAHTHTPVTLRPFTPRTHTICEGEENQNGKHWGPNSGAELTLWVLHATPGLGCVEEATLPTDQVECLHKVGTTKVLVDKSLGRLGLPEDQQGQQGQKAHPQGHDGTVT